MTAGLAVAVASVTCKSTVVIEGTERDGGGTVTTITTTTVTTTPPPTSTWTSTSTGTGMGQTWTTTTTHTSVPLEDWGVGWACSTCANQHCAGAADVFNTDPTYETLDVLWACLFGVAGEGACAEPCATLVCDSTEDVYNTPFEECNDCQNENCCDELAACEADPACGQCLPLADVQPDCCDIPLFVAWSACLSGGDPPSCSDYCPYEPLCD